MKIRWPWSRELDEARRQAQSAAREARSVEQREREANRLLDESEKASRALRTQVEINGWTELLQSAMGRAR